MAVFAPLSMSVWISSCSQQVVDEEVFIKHSIAPTSRIDRVEQDVESLKTNIREENVYVFHVLSNVWRKRISATYPRPCPFLPVVEKALVTVSFDASGTLSSREDRSDMSAPKAAASAGECFVRKYSKTRAST